ncbi:MAG: hypothetical protein H0W67_01630 [Gemmatimonadales bacterium]|nr:hypothetical protein [Gemmatimonadales bacterium]
MKPALYAQPQEQAALAQVQLGVQLQAELVVQVQAALRVLQVDSGIVVSLWFAVGRQCHRDLHSC